jgi:hypothetical protein
MIAEVATVVTVVDSDVDMQVILRSAAKAADELAKATEASEQKEKSLSVHSVVQHQQSQNTKIASPRKIELNEQIELSAQLEMKDQINLKSVESQNAHFVPTDIQKQSVLKNLIAQQR